MNIWFLKIIIVTKNSSFERLIVGNNSYVDQSKPLISIFAQKCTDSICHPALNTLLT